MKGKRTMILSTEKLQLHSMTKADEAAVIDMLTDPAVFRTYMVPELNTRAEAAKLFARFLQLSQSDDRFVYGVYHGSRLVGWVNEVDDAQNAVELGFVIAPAWQNHGFATEVLTVCIRELFRLGYAVVRTGAFEDNLPSIRVMEKCGMLRLPQTEDIPYRGKTHRCILFEIQKSPAH